VDSLTPFDRLDQNLLSYLSSRELAPYKACTSGAWLELGPGAYPVFSALVTSDDLPKGTTLYCLDCDSALLKQAQSNFPDSALRFIHADITNPPDALELPKFSLVFDSHLLHTLTKVQDRQSYFHFLHRQLSVGGVWALEHAVQASGGEFIYTDRAVPHSLELEGEILSAGFEICYLRVDRDHKFIFEPDRSIPTASDPDRLRLIAKKKPRCFLGLFLLK
jgi:hypothetical protein